MLLGVAPISGTTSKSIRATHDFESTNRLIGIGYDALFDFFGRDRGDSCGNDLRSNAGTDRSAILKAWGTNHLRGWNLRAATPAHGTDNPNPATNAGAEESREPENHRLRAVSYTHLTLPTNREV